ncbi:MAG: leucyl/phenylalanyl-tRNA--protein transferase [Dehalococcoidia bacterium]|nr:leucyl/phenylalanyl-tRNA--protein transferase [Dehalococcoidia bacterium]HCV00994.1 leucyl/phenylalanyl-tRNA--protein transferase [Dehalococcoidia bacterium]
MKIDLCTRLQPQPLPPSRFVFPDPRGASPSGFVAAGGDLAPETIVAAYRAGLFPWPHDGVDTLWWSPDPRAILVPERFHVSRRLARRVRQQRFRITVDAAFGKVIAACAIRPEGTWITPGIMRAYLRLHSLGWAHSFEVWNPEGRLVGGLYGLFVDGLFGAESMFHRASDASKIALLALCQHAPRSGIELIDVQLETPHLASLGSQAIPRERYLELLLRARASGQPNQ